jgi:hypothetical protein
MRTLMTGACGVLLGAPLVAESGMLPRHRESFDHESVLFETASLCAAS